MSSHRIRLVSAALLAAALASGMSGIAEARPHRNSVAPTLSAPVIVDVSRLRALGLGPTADLVQATIAGELRDRAPPGTHLVVRVTGLSIGSYAGSVSGSGGPGGGIGTDSMDGVGFLVGPGGEVRASYPIVLTLPSDSAGAYYLRDNERRRVVVLAQNFVRWITRELG